MKKRYMAQLLTKDWRSGTQHSGFLSPPFSSFAQVHLFLLRAETLPPQSRMLPVSPKLSPRCGPDLHARHTPDRRADLRHVPQGHEWGENAVL